MGNSMEKKIGSIKKKFGTNEHHSSLIKDNTIGIEIECPNCGMHFGPKALQIDVLSYKPRLTITFRIVLLEKKNPQLSPKKAKFSFLVKTRKFCLITKLRITST